MTDVPSRLTAAFASQYAIERELGRGGMATVYLAQDLKHHRRVALKVLRPELTAALGPDRFLREIEIAAQFAHPHIVPVFDSGEAGGFLYYVMPYVAGESLRSRLLREGQLPVDDAVNIASEVAGALAYAHAQGIIHRDIKPENILLAQGHALVADFGIARAFSAVTDTGEELGTAVGLVLGTPLYMSPEQSAGHARLDGRTDIYSLGCVLYEMLAGEPPFSGHTARLVIAQHAQNPPPLLRSKRPGVPSELEQVITKALHKLPADRFASAGEFIAALPRYQTPAQSQVPTVPVQARRRHPHVSRAGWALIGALALAGALTATAFHRRAAPALDASLYVVMPFRHRAAAAEPLLTGDQCESLLHDALGRWRGVQMVDPLWVADARSRRGGTSTVDNGLAIARQRRAGRVVLGEVWQFQDTVYVRGLLYDAAGKRLVREQSVKISPTLNDAQARFEELADSLLIGGGFATGTPPRSGGRLSLPAWRAFQDGYAALQRWNLDSSKVKLQRALAIDPTYATAQFWLAQVMAWAGDPPSSWKKYAAGSLASPDTLAPRDRSLAEGMLALAENRFPQACEKFRSILQRDSLDFGAWFGLGDCQGRDPLVVRDSTSPSGWRFRGSYHSAIQAYRRALEIVPSVHSAFRGDAFARLPELLFAESNRIRQGFALAPDTMHFGAFPSMTSDTIEFVPHPISDVVSARPGAVPPSVSAAVASNREVLRETATSWVTAFPDRAAAHATMALVLESLGELTSGRAKGLSALGEIREARSLAKDRSEALRLGVIEVRFLLKAEQMDSVRRLADSLLLANRNSSMDDARELRGLAALTGRVHLAAQLQRKEAPEYTFLTSDWQEITVPLPVADAALALLVYASFGTPIDSIVELERRIEQLIPSYVEPRLRGVTHQAVAELPAVLAFPERGAQPVHRAKAGGNYRLEMQWTLSRGDTAGLRKQFRELQSVRSNTRPGNIAFDGTYHEAQLLLALGDTAQATKLLEQALNALPTLGSYLLDQVPQAATLVRGMVLRADLAIRSGDTAEAGRWARNVTVLWANADPELRTTFKRMAKLAAEGR